MNIEIKGERVTTHGVTYHKVHDRPVEMSGVESILVRLGPYDNSEAVEIKYLPDTREVAVLHHAAAWLGGSECVLSVVLEEL